MKEYTPEFKDQAVRFVLEGVLDRAGQSSIAEACRTFGEFRTTYYRWADRAARYGLAALMPKQRRTPAMSNATGVTSTPCTRRSRVRFPAGPLKACKPR